MTAYEARRVADEVIADLCESYGQDEEQTLCLKPSVIRDAIIERLSDET